MVNFAEIFKDTDVQKKKRIRVGRGIGSGKGKTAGRGHKGQKSRSGVAIKGFEGGQMPIHRRLPKRGFKSNSSNAITIINLLNIQKLLDSKKIKEAQTINIELLKSIGYIKNNVEKIKLLANGDIKHKINVNFDYISKTAKEKIIKAGGKIEE
jgi:large subunit ribosomal protein L15